MKLGGKVAVITGAGQGIGRAISLALAQEGADVVIDDIIGELADNIADEIRAAGHRVLAIKADVTKEEEVDAMIKTTLSQFGKIDILVNNVGGSARERASEFKDSTREVWDFVIGRNLMATLICTRAVINHMIERRYGKIINIGSITGVGGGAGQVDYSAAKGGVIAFTKALAKEVGQYNINVNCVSPGVIKTAVFQQISHEIIDQYLDKSFIKRIGEPQDIAAIAAFLASDDASYITGANYLVDGGICI